jgi:hypothetical protein
MRNRHCECQGGCDGGRTRQSVAPGPRDRWFCTRGVNLDASGQTTYLDYTGQNLMQIRVVSQGVTQTLTRYTYDGQNRLVETYNSLAAAGYRAAGSFIPPAEAAYRSSDSVLLLARI